MKQYPEWLAGRYPQHRGRVVNHSWANYERDKAQWIAKNPGATSRQYEEAMLRIAKQWGV